MKDNKVKVIAFYLPQFHPIPENDKWWGKGFTEWTNVARAKPLFKGHYQPHIPADLGFYDLRLPEVRDMQAELAREAGITAFCYWHYWFGDGKQLLEKPLQEVVRLGRPDFPFMLGWANHSWVSKNWNTKQSSFIPATLMEQKYLGEKDIIDHFQTMLPVFKDKRYLRIHGRIAFLIYKIEDIPYFKEMKSIWNRLALENGLPEFFFIGHTEEDNKLNMSIYQETDANCLCRIDPNYFNRNFIHRLYRFVKTFVFRYHSHIVDYTDIVRCIDTPLYSNVHTYPTIIPCWDPSPRRGLRTIIYHNSSPKLFYKQVRQAIMRIREKPDEDQIIFLKSWNEWAEGNYMEPDLKWGKGYIEALREALEEAVYD